MSIPQKERDGVVVVVVVVVVGPSVTGGACKKISLKLIKNHKILLKTLKKT